MSRRYGLQILLIALTMVPSHAANISAEAPGEMKHGEPSALWSRSVAVRGPSPSRVTIQGTEIDGRFVPQTVSVPDDKSDKTSTAPLPLGTNLLDQLEPQLFGGEERVQIMRSKVGLTIHCGEGIAPAGIVLKTGASHFPRAARLRLVAAGAGSGEPLGLSIVEGGGDAPAPPQALTGSDGVSLKIPPSPADDPRDLVVNCPPGQASFRLNSLSLEPGPTTSQTSRTGTWLWNAKAWLAQPVQIEEWAVSARLDRVFLQLKIDDGGVTGGTALADLVGRLARRGISVHAVEGDPAMVTADGLSHALRRVAAIRRYQLAGPPAGRLAGLQFDIEPYLLADFALDPVSFWSRWAEAIQALSSAWGEPVSIVVPFWMLDADAGAAAIAAARPAISDLTVMAYRTEIGEVTSLSEPWLAWGALNDVPVRVAIENGPLDIEVHRTFVRAKTGSVLLRMGDRTATVSLFSEPVAARGAALAYAFQRETRVNPARISFMNNVDKLAVARAELSRLLAAWPSFDGLMIHALDETDRGLGGPRIPMPEARVDEPQAPNPDL
ncbi:hypothetical protein [Mesorhizobium sp. CAU 1732]|uniref:hypothetical protein n=1 Tax=Mesorhizobium sp. CAU 1732 TaxID=3140358 RepID=UPI003261A68B